MLNCMNIIVLCEVLTTLVLKIILLAFTTFNILHIDGVINILISSYCKLLENKNL